MPEGNDKPKSLQELTGIPAGTVFGQPANAAGAPTPPQPRRLGKPQLSAELFTSERESGNAARAMQQQINAALRYRGNLETKARAYYGNVDVTNDELEGYMGMLHDQNLQVQKQRRDQIDSRFNKEYGEAVRRNSVVGIDQFKPFIDQARLLKRQAGNPIKDALFGQSYSDANQARLDKRGSNLSDLAPVDMDDILDSDNNVRPEFFRKLYDMTGGNQKQIKQLFSDAMQGKRSEYSERGRGSIAQVEDQQRLDDLHADTLARPLYYLEQMRQGIHSGLFSTGNFLANMGAGSAMEALNKAFGDGTYNSAENYVAAQERFNRTTPTTKASTESQNWYNLDHILSSGFHMTGEFAPSLFLGGEGAAMQGVERALLKAGVQGGMKGAAARFAARAVGDSFSGRLLQNSLHMTKTAFPPVFAGYVEDGLAKGYTADQAVARAYPRALINTLALSVPGAVGRYGARMSTVPSRILNSASEQSRIQALIGTAGQFIKAPLTGGAAFAAGSLADSWQNYQEDVAEGRDGVNENTKFVDYMNFEQSRKEGLISAGTTFDEYKQLPEAQQFGYGHAFKDMAEQAMFGVIWGGIEKVWHGSGVMPNMVQADYIRTAINDPGQFNAAVDRSLRRGKLDERKAESMKAFVSRLAPTVQQGEALGLNHRTAVQYAVESERMKDLARVMQSMTNQGRMGEVIDANGKKVPTLLAAERPSTVNVGGPQVTAWTPEAGKELQARINDIQQKYLESQKTVKQLAEGTYLKGRTVSGDEMMRIAGRYSPGDGLRAGQAARIIEAGPYRTETISLDRYKQDPEIQRVAAEILLETSEFKKQNENPPIIDKDGTIIDGVKRIADAIANGADQLEVARPLRLAELAPLVKDETENAPAAAPATDNLEPEAADILSGARAVYDNELVLGRTPTEAERKAGVTNKETRAYYAAAMHLHEQGVPREQAVDMLRRLNGGNISDAMAEAFYNDVAARAKTGEPVPVVPGQGVDATAGVSPEITDFARRVMEGVEMDSPEDQVFYNDHQAEIEAEIDRISKPAPVPAPEIAPATDIHKISGEDTKDDVLAASPYWDKAKGELLPEFQYGQPGFAKVEEWLAARERGEETAVPDKPMSLQDRKAEELKGIGTGMAGSITGGIYKDLFDFVNGIDNAFGRSEPKLVAQARPVIESGEVTTPEQLRDFFNDPARRNRPAVSEAAKKVQDGFVRLNDISSDYSRFHGEEPLDEAWIENTGKQTADGRFDQPVKLWRDPVDKQLYVLDGKNRLEAARRMGWDVVNAEIREDLDLTSARRYADATRTEGREVLSDGPVRYITADGNYAVSHDGTKLNVTNRTTGKTAIGKYRAAAIEEAMNRYKFNRGLPLDSRQIAETATAADFGYAALESSNNPAEIALAWSVQEAGPQQMQGAYDAQILEHIKPVLSDSADYTRGDMGQLFDGNQGARMHWLTSDRSKGSTLSDIAHAVNESMSESDGIAQERVTADDVLDFMLRNPQGVRGFDLERAYDTPMAQDLAMKFERMTGFPLDKRVADIAIAQQRDGLSPEEQAIFDQEIRTHEELQRLYDDAVAAGTIVPGAEDVRDVTGEGQAPEGEGTPATPEQPAARQDGLAVKRFGRVTNLASTEVLKQSGWTEKGNTGFNALHEQMRTMFGKDMALVITDNQHAGEYWNERGQQFEDISLTPNAWVSADLKTIHLNIEKCPPAAVLDELGHVWIGWTRANAADIHKMGVQLAEASVEMKYMDDYLAGETPVTPEGMSESQADLWQRYADAYGLRENGRDILIEEVLTHAIQKQGQMLAGTPDRARTVGEDGTVKKGNWGKWLEALWSAVKDAAGFKRMTTREFSRINLDEFSRAAAEEIARGKSLTRKIREALDADVSRKDIRRKDAKKGEEIDESLQMQVETAARKPKIETSEEGETSSVESGGGATVLAAMEKISPSDVYGLFYTTHPAEAQRLLELASQIKHFSTPEMQRIPDEYERRLATLLDVIADPSLVATSADKKIMGGITGGMLPKLEGPLADVFNMLAMVGDKAAGGETGVTGVGIAQQMVRLSRRHQEDLKLPEFGKPIEAEPATTTAKIPESGKPVSPKRAPKAMNEKRKSSLQNLDELLSLPETPTEGEERFSLPEDPEKESKRTIAAMQFVADSIEDNSVSLAEIMTDVHDQMGDRADVLYPYIKRAYLAYQAEAPDAILDRMDDPRAVRAFDFQALKQQLNATDTESGLEPDSPRTDAQNGVGQEDVQPANGRSAVEGAGPRGEEVGAPEQGPERAGDNRVPADAAAADGATGDSGLPGGESGTGESEAGTARGFDSGRSGWFGNEGQRPAAGRTAPASRFAGPSTRGVNQEKLEKQRAAESLPIIPLDAQNIADTLPYLMPSQHEDVGFIEKRFARPDGYGVLLANGTGTGKAQPLDAAILTPSGWTVMGQLRVGDSVISVDGKPTTVTGVFPQGSKEIFRVIFSDGTSTECCDEHLWLTQTLYERRKGNANPNWDCAKPKVRNLNEIRRSLSEQHFIPINDAVYYQEKNFLISPYIMGVILGDGGMSCGRAVSLSSEDESIPARVASELQADIILNEVSVKDRCRTWRFTKRQQSRLLNGAPSENPFVEQLRDMGLMGCTSSTKFIPDQYFIGSIEQREALLQGILDTDGTIDKRTGTVVFTSVSGTLAEDVAQLVRSLGGTAIIHPKKTSYTHKGLKQLGKLAFNVTICLPNNIQPFYLSRKVALVKPKVKYFPKKKIVAVESVGFKEAQCIAVDHPTHLYITDQYIVTHNTFTGLGAVKRMIGMGKTDGIIVAPNEEVIKEWVTSAPALGIEIKQLKDTVDPGQGISITTYANFRDNDSIFTRPMDWIIMDEAHSIIQSGTKDQSLSLDALRAITLHPNGASALAIRRNRRLYDELQTMRDKVRDTELDKLSDEDVAALDALQEKWNKHVAQTKRLIEFSQGDARPRAIFLSATPFAYDKNVDWAQGFLFEYPKYTPTGRRNEPNAFQQFMIQHFGYSMKDNKMRRPDANVDSELMERNFNAWMRKQGAMSTRSLDLDSDYQRLFALTPNAVGTKIDEGLEFLREGSEGKYKALYDIVEKRFDYIARARLLEAIKAHAFVPIIKQAHALGRKVVVYHDYIHGGAFSPFRFDDMENGMVGIKDNGKARGIRLHDLAEMFYKERPDLAGINFDQVGSPLETLRETFPNALIINGPENRKLRRVAIERFNDDADPEANLIIVQSGISAGWSGHDKTGKHPRMLINLGQPVAPTAAIQQEGRIYRVGQHPESNSTFVYGNTGTMWERHAFASKIAERAATAENLAMGFQARGLKRAFIEAFENSATYIPSSNDGRGSRDADREQMQEMDEFKAAKTYYFAQQKKNARTKAMEGVDYYATPEPIGFKMVQWAQPRSGESWLEPSAGHGAIARFIPERLQRTIIEPSTDLFTKAQLNVLGAKGIQDQFENLHINNKFDGIVMNPPFGTAGTTASEHVQKAVSHLRPGGRIVALVPVGAFDGKFEKWFSAVDSRGRAVHPDLHLVARVKMPSATFERAGTKVNTQILIIDKAADPRTASTVPTRNIDLAEMQDIKSLFDRIENMDMPSRPGSEKSTTAPEAIIPVPEFDQSTTPRPPIERATPAAVQAAPVADPQPAEQVKMKEPVKTMHQKAGKDIWVVQRNRSLSDAEFSEARDAAKRHGGYWSSFKGGGAIPGFIFSTPEGADAFHKEVANMTQPESGGSQAVPADYKLPASATNEQQEIYSRWQSAGERLVAAREKISSTRRDLDRRIVDDGANLFGERQSQAGGSMFDIRVDPTQRDVKLQPLQDAVTKAEVEHANLGRQLAEAGSKPSAQSEMFSLPLREAMDEARMKADQGNDRAFETYVEGLGEEGQADPESLAARGELFSLPLSRRGRAKNILSVHDRYFVKEDANLGNRELAKVRAAEMARRVQEEIKGSIGDKPKGLLQRKAKTEWESRWRDTDRAIHIYLDTQRNPAHIADYNKALADAKVTVNDPNATPLEVDKARRIISQENVVKMSQKLSKGQKDIADNVAREYDKIGALAINNGIIKDVIDNYVARAWDFGSFSTEENNKFNTSTRHSMKRTLDTILEGFTHGYTLKIQGASNNLAVLYREINNVIENQRLLEEGLDMKDDDGKQLFSISSRRKDYVKIDNPSFRKWQYVGRLSDYSAQDRASFNRDTIVSPSGAVLRKLDVYAPKDIAQSLNNIFGRTKFDNNTIQGLTKFNAAVKQSILSASVFHYIAFTRAHILGHSDWLKNPRYVSPRAAYRAGLEMMAQDHPLLQKVIQNGMTVGRMQDFQEGITEHSSRLGRAIDSMGGFPAAAKKSLLDFNHAFHRHLFENYGAGLKAFDAIALMKKEMKANPNESPDVIAQRVAKVMNDSYGGVNWNSHFRGNAFQNPTVRHLSSLLLLAPDWTTSNLRLFRNAFRTGEQGNLYRKMWAKVILRGVTLTAFANAAMAAMDDEEGEDWYDAMVNRYQKGWDAGHLRWTMVDITPMYHALGGDPEKRSYFSIFGAYTDPMRMMGVSKDKQGNISISSQDFLSHKASFVTRAALESFTGENWQHKQFTTLDEMLGIDEKGEYKYDQAAHTKGEINPVTGLPYAKTQKAHAAGEAKGGKNKGSLTRYPDYGGGVSIWKKPSIIPSYLGSQMRGMLPTALQSLMAAAAGENDWAQFAMQAPGTGVVTSKDPSK